MIKRFSHLVKFLNVLSYNFGKRQKNPVKIIPVIGLAPTEDQPVLQLISSVYTGAFMHFLSFCSKTTINIDGLTCNII